MVEFKVWYMDSGWDDDKFEQVLQSRIEQMVSEGFVYYDIKISSSGNHSMIIFKKVVD